MSNRPPRQRVTKDLSRTLPRYDQALLAAKNNSSTVAFDLATPTGFTDAEGTVEGQVCQVDKYSIEILVRKSGKKVWISKAMIVGTEIL